VTRTTRTPRPAPPSPRANGPRRPPPLRSRPPCPLCPPPPPPPPPPLRALRLFRRRPRLPCLAGHIPACGQRAVGRQRFATAGRRQPPSLPRHGPSATVPPPRPVRPPKASPLDFRPAQAPGPVDLGTCAAAAEPEASLATTTLSPFALPLHFTRFSPYVSGCLPLPPPPIQRPFAPLSAKNIVPKMYAWAGFWPQCLHLSAC
jgi:hypothetical protein